MSRVVVTGLGAVTSVGNNVPDTWDAVVNGRSGVGPITHFDASSYSTRIAAQVRDLTPEPYLSRKEARRIDPLLQFAVCAAGQAVDDAQIDTPQLDRRRVGVLIGAGIGGMRTMTDAQNELLARGPQSISPFFIPSIITNMTGGIVAQKYGLTGPNFAVSSACATGNHAIGEAAAIIQCGAADAMVCGSAEASIVELGIGGFCAMRAMSTHNDDPAGACRPFDLHRDGFVMGEGAGALVLESLEHAQRRGARIYAELTGYGATADAYHLVAPEPDGRGAAEAMRLTLESAQLAPDEIDYINAHGTGTDLNDKIETIAIKTTFGDAAYRIPISSTKPITGHVLGGAGAIEAVISVLALVHNLIPPTINLTTPDPECDLDYVPLVARPAALRAVMSNGFGFGGHNACIVFQAFE
ncbi:MAG: beta-ketoacyl-ACP synthase II [Anaerolineae bacterium]|nr:beta-ketoacyl-ACP synthase II [Anaerolineae bacterium]